MFVRIHHFQVNNRNEPGPVLGILMDDTGSTEHAFSFWGYETFNSNLKFTLTRGNTYNKTKRILDHCCHPQKFERLKLVYRFKKRHFKNVCYHQRERKKCTK